MNVKIRQIYFSDDQQWRLDRGFTAFFNCDKSKYLENDVILKLWEDGDCDSDYYGTISYKFKYKIGLTSDMVYKALDHDSYSNDVYSFFSRWNKKNLWKDGDYYHQTNNFTKIGNYIFNKLGYGDVADLRTAIVYYNFWIARKEVVDKYVKKILIPVRKMMETDEDLQKLLYLNANYRNYRNQMMNKDQCMEFFERPYYTYHPFVMERLFGTFLTLEGISLKHIK